MLPGAVKPFAEWAAAILEIGGIGVILLVALAATVAAIVRAIRHEHWDALFHAYRLAFSRGILLGLEFLVAADIIHTVAVELSWSSVGVLAVIVLIRTFLSFTLEVEITGRWPWRRTASGDQ